MKKYLYLTEHAWVAAWETGGEVPLNCASSYKRIERQGIYTPDENLIDNSSHDILQFGPLFEVENGTVTVGSINVNSVKIAENITFDRKTEDGLVLCLANRRSNFIAKKLEKKACVQIVDIHILKSCLDEQIGIISEMKECSYTSEHYRNRFLKSSLDSWQDEYRLFWPNAKPCNVYIPPGMAKRVPIRGI